MFNISALIHEVEGSHYLDSPIMHSTRWMNTLTKWIKYIKAILHIMQDFQRKL